MPDELALVDTNVLVYAHYRETEHHVASRDLFEQAQKGQVLLCMVPQVLIEFYSIVTSPRRVTQPREPEEVLDEIDRLRSMPGMTLLPTPPNVADLWIDYLRQSPVIGPAVFDVQLVAAMVGNGVRRIYTFDRSSFEKFADLIALTPGVAE